MRKRYTTMPDLPLIQAIVRDEAGAWKAFVDRYVDDIYTLCALVYAPEESDAACRKVFAMLREENYAMLRAFEGRGTLKTYLTVTLRQRLAEQLLSLFAQDADRAWQAFERFFKRDMMEVIAKYFPAGQSTRTASSDQEDRYQEIRLVWVEQGYPWCQAYGGRGSVAGFVRGVVRRECINLIRKEWGKRALPKVMEQRPLLEQEVFKFLYWQGHPEDAGRTILLSQNYPPVQAEAALSHMRSVIESARQTPKRLVLVPLPTAETTGTTRPPELPDSRFIPEQTLLEWEAQESQARRLKAIQEAVERLPNDEKQVITGQYLTNPARTPAEMAAIMGAPVERIYSLRANGVVHIRAYLNEARGMTEEGDLR